VNSEKSSKIIHDFLDGADFSYEMVLSDDDMEVSRVVLFRADGQEITAGAGKGRHHVLSAHAEAIEHYISINVRTAAQEKRRLKEVVHQSAFKKDYYIQQILEKGSEDIIPVEKFHKFTSDEACWVPAGYVDPFTPDHAATPEGLNETTKSLAKLASNNGGALGLCFEDSLLHGLNECIERHYLSKFFQDMIGHKTSVSWIIYDDELNFSYIQKRKSIEQKLGHVITVYAQTVFGSYAAFSFLPDNKKPCLHLVGGGSSVSLPMAIQRSIDELAQIELLKTFLKEPKFLADFEEAFQIVYAYDGLRPLIELPEKRILSIAQTVKYSPMETSLPRAMSPSQQVNYLVENIVTRGYTPTYRTLSSSKGVWVTQIFVPGFDAFYLIQNGILVAPMEEYRIP
jgi:hypothetical protein